MYLNTWGNKLLLLLKANDKKVEPGRLELERNLPLLFQQRDRRQQLVPSYLVLFLERKGSFPGT